MANEPLGEVTEQSEGEDGSTYYFAGKNYRTRDAANQARQVEENRRVSTGDEYEPPGGPKAPDEGVNIDLPGTEFRTTQQRRAESELAEQVGTTRMSEIKPPDAPKTVDMETAPLTTSADEFISTTNKLLGDTPEASTTKAADATQVTEAPTLAAPQGTAATVAGQEADMTAATLAAPTKSVDASAAEGTVSAPSIATAQTEELDEKATLTFQLDKLFKGFQPGETPPAWATPAMRRVTSIMTARGLGSSSMAAGAQVQAIMEAGIPLAREDAQRYATMQLQNLSNRQQTALANAGVYAAMDQTNVGVRLQAQIQNAQNFLSIDTANLTNLQQGEVLNQQAHNQALFSDQAAKNAMEQLNVGTEAQTDQFFSQLGVTVRDNNANRKTAVDQFNAGQANTIEVFNKKQDDLRERYNSELRASIEASNVQHKRAVTTRNNVNQMLVNEFNAREVNSMNVRDYQQLYLTYRDTATRIYSTAENNENRATQLAQSELQASATRASGGGKSSILPTLISAGATVAAAMI